MFSLSNERWRELSPFLDHGIELEDADRAAWLASIRADNPGLAPDLEALLNEHAALRQEAFLDRGAVLPHDRGLEGQIMGDYTLVSAIGQGGMASVWLARRNDGRFESQVAVKILNTVLAGRVGGERLRREGAILARLVHPHITRLIDVGISSIGHPYLVLEHVEGEHVDRYCNSRGLGIEARIRLFLDILDAVAHAHAKLVVHRDIKPPNILVTRQGEVKLLDFGIAKLLDSAEEPGAATLPTREGGWALTPEFAAPEQVSGGPITTATDVYSLGVLLFLLLGGERRVGSPAEMMRAVVEAQLPTLSNVPRDLAAIVAKASKKDPAKRYASATVFADDLRKFLDHERVPAAVTPCQHGCRSLATRYGSLSAVR